MIKIDYGGREMELVLKGAGGPRPKILFDSIFVEGKQSYEMLFIRSKKITLQSHALLAIISKF